MIIRLIILFLAIWVIAGFLARFLARGPGAPSGTIPRMVRCDYCGLFLPENEAIASGQHFYCCKQHEPPEQK